MFVVVFHDKCPDMEFVQNFTPPDFQAKKFTPSISPKGWLAIPKLKPLSLFISLLLMLKKALDNDKMVK